MKRICLLLALLPSVVLCQVNWRETMHVNLWVDCYQTLGFPARGHVELNPILGKIQKAVGYEIGTVAYFAGVSVLLDEVGKRHKWVYPAVSILQSVVIIQNRRLGVGGMPFISFNWKF